MLVDVPKKSWGRRLLKLFAFALLTFVAIGVMAGVGAYLKFGSDLPAIPQVDLYHPPVVTELWSQDAVLSGELYNERRKVVPYERIPKRLVQAFIAAEDASFFDHGGVDLLGTVRAVSKTVLKKVTGRGSVQGGSTLTQQTAKAILVSDARRKVLETRGLAGKLTRESEAAAKESFKTATEKSPKRKIREAILARRLEAALTKEEILYLYLNNVYLGHHAYGVESAAENYYRKDVKDLTLGEMALIAGLPQAPSSFSPFTASEKAKKRRHYVLGQMLEKGMISKTEHDQADQEEIRVYPVEDVFHELSPYFTEEVRKAIVDRYGNVAALEEGLQIFTTMDSEKQRAAQDSVLAGLLAVDKRQGYRGALLHLESPKEREAFIARGKTAMGEEKLTPGRFYVGVVTQVDREGLTADVNVGGQVAKLPALGARWARPVNSEHYYNSGVMLNKLTKVVSVGDVIPVRVVADKNGLYDDREQYSSALEKEVPEGVTLVRLEQDPELQSALVSIDPHRQYLVAMVGGYDFDANEFNRAFQACRQPGSGFKPIVYSAAIEKMNWTEATVLVDSPLVYDDPENQNRWKPENYSEGYVGEVLLRTALVNSMNIPAVKTYIELTRFLGKKNEPLGIKLMGEYVKNLGISTPLNPDFSTALGSSCVYPYELVQVYATINRLGEKKPTYFVRKVADRYGRTIEDHTAFDDPWASLTDRVAGGYARIWEPGEQVMEKETAYIVTDLMRGVVREGTGAAANRLGKPAAGKTGTTNDSFDAWFTGFTRDLVTSAWVGYDLNQHPLNRAETGGKAALPIWLAYMKGALDGRAQPEFSPPASLDLVRLRIDEKTGKVATVGKGVKDMWFKRDTEPKDKALDKGSVGTDQFMLTR
ncbi:MAG: transglycosylase domain-containing protein [Archangiaceae bacterium]|nr:transglycosylase domain-containing protein [Archangiaceae bacterium]